MLLIQNVHSLSSSSSDVFLVVQKRRLNPKLKLTLNDFFALLLLLLLLFVVKRVEDDDDDCDDDGYLFFVFFVFVLE